MVLTPDEREQVGYQLAIATLNILTILSRANQKTRLYSQNKSPFFTKITTRWRGRVTKLHYTISLFTGLFLSNTHFCNNDFLITIILSNKVSKSISSQSPKIFTNGLGR